MARYKFYIVLYCNAFRHGCLPVCSRGTCLGWKELCPEDEVGQN